MPEFTGITHILLDIEGTTCPIEFVTGVLFPFAQSRIESFLLEHHNEGPVNQLLQDTELAWQNDTDESATAMRKRSHQRDINAIAKYLILLIHQDRKLTALKDIQGMVWEEGYLKGELTAPLYEDVPIALKQWHRNGLTLSVYSSGSVPAQKLLYRYSSSGDLRGLFSHWFDTRIGPKQDPSSYTAISEAMQVSSEKILFISDSLAECKAADAAGLAVLFSDRPGNPCNDGSPFTSIKDYNDLIIL